MEQPHEGDDDTGVHGMHVDEIAGFHAHVQRRQDRVQDHFQVLLRDGGEPHDLHALVGRHSGRVVAPADHRHLVSGSNEANGEFLHDLLDSAVGRRNAATSDHHHMHRSDLLEAVGWEGVRVSTAGVSRIDS